MNELSIKRVGILSKLKLQTIYINQVVVSTIFLPIIIAAGGVLIFEKFLGGLKPEMATSILVTAALVNAIYNGIFIPTILMAEEKEKNTLRVLMVSSVTGLEYFFGSILANLLVMGTFQLLLLPIMNIEVTLQQFLLYSVVSLITLLTSNVIGMCFGLLVKDQMAATLAPLPVIFAIWMIPMFRNMNETMNFIGGLFYSTALKEVITILSSTGTASLSVQSWLVLIVEFILVVILFLYLYKKNGFESD